MFRLQCAKANSVCDNTFIVSQEFRDSLVGFWAVELGLLAVRHQRKINKLGAAFKRIRIDLLAGYTNKCACRVQIDVKYAHRTAADVRVDLREIVTSWI